MEQKVKVSFYLKKNEVNGEGKCPVMARLTIGQSESVFSAKMTMPCVSLWALGRATGKSLAAGMIKEWFLFHSLTTKINHKYQTFYNAMHHKFQTHQLCDRYFFHRSFSLHKSSLCLVLWWLLFVLFSDITNLFSTCLAK